jgi:membrane-associated protein
MYSIAASFDTQFATFAPFLLYVVVGAVVFVETGLLFGFFLPGDSILFSAGLVAASQGNINIALMVIIIVIAAFFGDQIGFVIGRVIGRPYLDRKKSPRIQTMIANA